MTERRRAARPDGRSSEESNPFAAPPEGTPDQPWDRRRDTAGRGHDGDGGREGGGGDGHDGGRDGNGNGGDGNGHGGDGQDGGDGRRSPWGRQWSSRQPRRESGGFGQSPEERPKPDGAPGPRWDPSDLRQRHARYAALTGSWALLSALLNWEWLALFTIAFALYWGIGALRGHPRPEGGAAERQRDPAARRSLVLWASCGVVSAGLALSLVAANFTVQMVYRDYFECAQDALTDASRKACAEHLPEVLHPVYVDTD